MIGDVEEFTKRFRVPGSTKLLTTWQASVLDEIARGMNVERSDYIGHGKHLCVFLAPRAKQGCKVAVALVEPRLAIFYRDEYQKWRQHFVLPSAWFDGYDRGFIVEGAPVLHVVTLARLSRADNGDLLHKLKPDLLIFPRQHDMSVRNARLYDYVSKCGPQTIEWRSIA